MGYSLLRRFGTTVVLGALLSFSLQGCITIKTGEQDGPSSSITPFGTPYEVFLRADRKMQDLIAADLDAMPSIEDSGIRDLFDILTDQDHAFGSDAFPVDFDQPVCPIVTHLSNQYMTHMDRQTKARFDQRRAEGRDPKPMLIQAINANTQTYQKELFALQDFGIRCMAETTASAIDLVSSLPASEMTQNRQEALSSSRQSAITIVKSALLITADPKIDPTLAKNLITTLTQSAPKLVSGLNPRQRRSLQRQITSSPSPYSLQIFALAQAIDTAPCGPVCEKY
jgi:hypothetical protein